MLYHLINVNISKKLLYNIQLYLDKILLVNNFIIFYKLLPK